MATGVALQLGILLAGLPVLGTPAAGLAYLGCYIAWILVVGGNLISIDRRVRE
jgi:hypothetical protein